MKGYQKISVIVPFYNEEGNVEFVLNEINTVLCALDVEFEIIAIDDGSKDSTAVVLEEVSRKIAQLKVISYSKNHGKDSALWGGFEASSGDIIMMMDGDRQNDFRDAPKMLNYFPEYDAVYGQRVRRKDPVVKLIATRIAFLFRRVVLGDTVRDTACALKAVKRDTLKYLIPMEGFHRFIPFLLQQAGVVSKAIEVNHRPRVSGETKYSLLKFYFFPVIGDLIFMWWYRINNLLKKRSRIVMGRREAGE